MKKKYLQPTIKVRLLAAKPVLYTTSIKSGGQIENPSAVVVDAKESSPFIDYFYEDDSSGDIEWNM